MAYNRRMAYRYNSYATKKIPYIKILIGIKIVLSIACREKEKN